jgi:hypothetical protein
VTLREATSVLNEQLLYNGVINHDTHAVLFLFFLFLGGFSWFMCRVCPELHQLRRCRDEITGNLFPTFILVGFISILFFLEREIHFFPACYVGDPAIPVACQILFNLIFKFSDEFRFLNSELATLSHFGSENFIFIVTRAAATHTATPTRIYDITHNLPRVHFFSFSKFMCCLPLSHWQSSFHFPSYKLSSILSRHSKKKGGGLYMHIYMYISFENTRFVTLCMAWKTGAVSVVAGLGPESGAP